jgi:hypothetical protein
MFFQKGKHNDVLHEKDKEPAKKAYTVWMKLHAYREE